MRFNLKYLKAFLLLVFIFSQASLLRAQESATVDHIEFNGTPPDKSYIVNTYGVIRPGSNGVTISGTSGNFFLRVNTQRDGVPSPGQNYIRTETLLVPVSLTQANTIYGLSPDQKNTSFEYFDALGRSIQKVQVKSTPGYNDAISFSVFDEFGREVKKYLPYTIDGSGAFRTSPESEALSFYSGTTAVPSDQAPFAKTEFDNSPLNKVDKAYAAGWNWHTDSENLQTYNRFKLNVDGEVRLITYSATATPTVSGTHPANTLLITEATDPSGQIKKQYKNFKGQLILERLGDGTTWHDTYHVYDISGNLAYVFPPQAIGSITDYTSSITETSRQSFLNTWAFQYKYDEYGRLISKRVPGVQDWTDMIYDKWDRLVLTQDANQKATSQWTFTKYDIFNRPIISGFITGEKTSLRSSAASTNVRYETRQSTAIGYGNNAFPTHTESDLLTITYYDDYAFINYPGWDAEGLSYTPIVESGIVSVSGIWGTNSPIVKGQSTGTKVKILNGTKWLNTVTYYDKEYQAVQTISENHLGGLDVVSKAFDFTGKETIAKRTHTSPGVSLWVKERYEYDQAGRLLRLYHQLEGGDEVLMASNKYNELGQLIEKNIHSVNGGPFLQSIDMRYNIQGWVTHINNSTLTNDGVTNDDTDDVFGMEIAFNESLSLNNGSYVTKKMFDGNVSGIKWKIDTKDPNMTPEERVYGFKYDAFKRFNSSYYATKVSSNWTGKAGYFNESVSYYDKNGNIGGGSTAALSRYGIFNGSYGQMDNLTYRYSGNQLKNITDNANLTVGFFNPSGVSLSTDEYYYDANGNMTEDMNRSISEILYNHLNFPYSIAFTRSNGRIDKIEYEYDAIGNKLAKVVKIGTTESWRTDYVAGIQYDKAEGQTSRISFLSTPEGRLVDKGNGFEYEYFYKDHQNNVRVVYGLAKDVVSYYASMEGDVTVKSDEEATFRNIANRRNSVYNNTRRFEKVLQPNESVLCNYTSPVGPAKMLRVQAGDEIYIEVFARYQNTVGTSTISAATLVTALTSPASFNIPNSGETATLYNGFNTNAPSLGGAWNNSSTTPKAYLAFLFFNDAYVNVPSKSGADIVSTAAFQSFEKLKGSVKIEESGYLYIYTANESSASSAATYFDDMYIVHQKNNIGLRVFQSSDYYPFGLAFNEYQLDQLKNVGTVSSPVYEPTLRNRIRFQDQELQSDHDLGWYHYKYRMHDPSSGRFSAIDPLSEKYMYNSTYAFSENKLTIGVELEGGEVLPTAWAASFAGSLGYHTAVNGGNVGLGLWDMTVAALTNKYLRPAENIHNGIKEKIIDNSHYRENTGIYNSQIAPNGQLDNVHTFNQLKANAKIFDGTVKLGGNFIEAEGFAIGMAGNYGSNLISRLNVPKIVRLNPVPTPQTTALTRYWPTNGGALGEWNKAMSFAGQQMDRYGLASGTYASPLGTPFEMRALSTFTDPADYFRFEVLKPFPYKWSYIAPAFDQPGLGIQYQMPMPINYLEEFGYIRIY